MRVGTHGSARAYVFTQSLRLPPLTTPRTENTDDDFSPVG
jgi:hypothetical protein